MTIWHRPRHALGLTGLTGALLAVLTSCAAGQGGAPKHPVAAVVPSPRRAAAPTVRPLDRPASAAVTVRAIAAAQVVRMQIPGPGLDLRSTTAYVYLPPGYATSSSRRYPVLYLHHGWYGKPDDWFSGIGGDLLPTMNALLAAHRIKPMIVVAPESGGGWRTDTECLEWAHAPRLETYLTRDVVRTVDATFRTIPTRAGRVAGGYSSGAFCAVNLGLRHLDEFGAVAALSPYASPGPYAQFGSAFGTYGEYLANLPLHYLPSMRFDQSVAVYLGAGTGDRQILTDAKDLAAALRRRGQRVTLDVLDGTTHDWPGVRAALPSLLEFASAQLNP